MKQRFIIYLISFLALIAIVGSGFALFFFGEQSKSESQDNITISVSDSAVPGTLTVEDPDDVTYGIFFNSLSPYIYRSDNITKGSSFKLVADLQSTGINIPSGYTVSLMCYIQVSDSDERGIKYNPEAYSDSIVDYLAASRLNFSDKSVQFSIYDESDTETSQVYYCTIDEDILATTNSSIEYNFDIEFVCKNNLLSEAATKNIAKAKENSKIKILFELVLVEKQDNQESN